MTVAMEDLVRGPTEVVGYHGCRRDVAERVLAGEPLLTSANRYDWLGLGAYFWEWAPFRARDWANERHGAEGAVLKATLTLGRCLNLLDAEHFSGLQQSYALLAQRLPVQHLVAFQNRGLRHDLDSLVVNAYCEDFVLVAGTSLQTVFAGSQILSKTSCTDRGAGRRLHIGGRTGTLSP